MDTKEQTLPTSATLPGWDANGMEAVEPAADTDTTNAELKALAKRVAELKAEITKRETDLGLVKEDYQKLSGAMLRALELMDVESIRAHGYLFYKETKTSVPVPKTLEDKQALFDYLQERGIFLESVSVHSQTLNSLYRTYAEEAAEKGVLDFRMPGVGEPTSFVNLKLRKA